jgi:hypothetical protein
MGQKQIGDGSWLTKGALTPQYSVSTSATARRELVLFICGNRAYEGRAGVVIR